MAKKVILIVLGAILSLVGVLGAIAGAALLVLFGSNGTLHSGFHQVESSAVALVSPVENIQHVSGFDTTFGTPTIRVQGVTSKSSGGVFIGVAPASEVNSYLAGAPIDLVNSVETDPFHLDKQLRAGSAMPAPPNQQSFWTISASGNTRADFAWRIHQSGSYRLVIMRTDAAPNIRVSTNFGVTIPHIFGISLGVLLGGCAILLIGVSLIVIGARAKTRPAPSGA